MPPELVPPEESSFTALVTTVDEQPTLVTAGMPMTVALRAIARILEFTVKVAPVILVSNASGTPPFAQPISVCLRQHDNLKVTFNSVVCS